MRAALLLIAVALVAALTACGGPNPILPLSTPTRPPIVFPTPPPGWTVHAKSSFQLALPESWREFPLEETALRDALDRASVNNPHLSDTLRALLESGQHKSLTFYAADTASAGVVGNVAVTRATLASGTAIEQTANDYANALPQLIKGAKVIAARVPLDINGLSAAEIEYDIPLVNAGGEVVTLRGVQFIFLLDSGGLYLVTVTGDAAVPSFNVLAQQIGRSFVGVQP